MKGVLMLSFTFPYNEYIDCTKFNKQKIQMSI